MTREHPNILLITTDQQRFDTVGEYAPDFLRTPHTDFLQRQGVTFDAAYSTTPICAPTRASILTGTDGHTHGMLANDETTKYIGHEETLPSYLGSLGYQTAAIGKMHFGPPRARHGFDEMHIPNDYYLEMERSDSDQMPMRHGLGQNEHYPTQSTVPESQTLTSWIAEMSLEYIRRRRDPTRPFFLWTSFSKPHPPLDPPEPYYSMYRDADIPKPVYGDWCDEESCPAVMQRRPWTGYDVDLSPYIEDIRAAYYGLVTQIDYNMGRVFGALDDEGLLDETLIVFASDHGDYLGDHRVRNKAFFHDPSARVPFVVRPPRTYENHHNGERVSEPITHSDLLPTLVSVAGGTPPDDVDGQDLFALIEDDLEDPREYVLGLSATVSDCDYLGLTDGEWKYIWYPEDETEHLFDLREDPDETTNLATDPEYDNTREQLRRELVARLEARDSRFVEDGELIRVSRPDDAPDPVETPWEGFLTEYNEDTDIKH